MVIVPLPGETIVWLSADKPWRYGDHADVTVPASVSVPVSNMRDLVAYARKIIAEHKEQKHGSH